MDPIVLIHGYSAESSDTTPGKIAGIYGTFPQDLRKVYGAKGVVDVDVSRYVSLEDGVNVDDISRALDRALRQAHPQLLQGRFHVIVHSTGALVIRNWVRRFSPLPSPVRSIVYLAGANLGSGWAQIGKGQVAKWGRYVFQDGAERGVQVLDALELGSSWTIDLHQHFLAPGTRMRADYDIFEFVVTGSQADVKWFEAPIRYAKEDGSDGVVRVSSSNVNHQYVRIGPKDVAHAVDWKTVDDQVTIDTQRAHTLGDPSHALYEVKTALTHQPGEPGCAPLVPVAIPYECAHTGDEMGIVSGTKPRAQVMKLVETALAVTTDAEWAAARAVFEAETATTYQEALKFQAPPWWSSWIQEPRAQYDKHAQVIFRVRDQDGRAVVHHDVYFDSDATAFPIKDLMEDTHVNELDPNVILFYVRTDHFDGKKWEPRIQHLKGVFLEISATEPQTDEIQYLPLRFSFDDLTKWIVPHRTTIVDVELLRIPSDELFVMVNAG